MFHLGFVIGFETFPGQANVRYSVVSNRNIEVAPCGGKRGLGFVGALLDPSGHQSFCSSICDT